MSAIGPFMAPSLRTSELYILTPTGVGSPSPRSPAQFTSFRLSSTPPMLPQRANASRVPPASKTFERYSLSPPPVSPQAKKPRRPSTANSEMSTLSSSSNSSNSSCSSYSSEVAKAWMKSARKHWNQAILHLDLLLSNWVLFDEEIIINLRKTFVTLDFHMKSIIGSTSESLAKRYCYEAECLRRSVESYAKSSPQPSTHKADNLIVAALKHLFVNRKTSNEAVRLGIRFAAQVVRSSVSEDELLEWARFFHNNAVYDETAEQLEAAIAELHSVNCMEDAGACKSAAYSLMTLSKNRRRNIFHSVAETQRLKSCFED
ncbi:hypothetical protein BDN71DRAFT_1430075 [Pleurotus eryngii]|uniref:Uncharacterized protein n=1 Tax=Pleurotus eryngii TaxID=5323 RepID=A0A9P6D9S7_PLEER|nr:hypothetical protein BDN71DRAFT_1430075 [Pleurotus eryngii]